MNLMRTLFVLLLLAFSNIGCHPAPEDMNPPAAAIRASIKRLDGTTLTPEQIAGTVERLMSAGKVPGLALAILNEGNIVYRSGFGTREIGLETPVTVNSVMSAASFTKAMFAHAVMQLVDEGILDLDKPVHEYLPKPLPHFSRYADLARDERWKQFTTRMLLSHTTGLPNWRWFNPDKKLDIKFEPGTKYSYSGEGIDLLQFVVEQITGQSTAALMSERVFTRFGMPRSGMIWKPEFKTDLAVGHDENGKALGHKRWKVTRG
jgi:CubicO group peptidase (beta-lactamase class C family)